MTQKAQLARHGLFDAKVPRYTSYPTAPHFENNVDSEVYTQWLSEIPAHSQVSLYVHVPFCRRLCWFCACRTQGTQSDAPVRAYLEVLKAEIAMLKQRLPQGVTLSRLHWGGGTPTLLAPAMMEELAGAITDLGPFAPGAEFSVEIDPNELDDARLDALMAAGMTRASVGVQDFDPDIQKSIGRLQSFEQTRDVVQMLRDRGIASLNADILYGLPHQNRTRITQSVQKLLSLSPDRVALYGYAHVPWMARRQVMIPADALPTAEARLDLFETARDLFLWDGYGAVGIDHFALPGDSLGRARDTATLRRNFQGYTDDPADVLIGLGASSISRFPQGYAQNAPATSAYTKAIRAKTFSISRGHAFTPQDKLRGRLIEALMCDFRINRSEIEATFAPPAGLLDDLFATVSRQYPDMVKVTADGFEIPEHAIPLTRMIAKGFDAYDPSIARHSAAV